MEQVRILPASIGEKMNNIGGFKIPTTYVFRERRSGLLWDINYKIGQTIYRFGFWIVMRGTEIMGLSTFQVTRHLDLSEWIKKYE